MARSTLGSLVPLIILFAVVLVGAAIGFVVYSIANEVADKTSKKMEKHNLSFSKDGCKIAVKGKTAEEMEDGTQNVLMQVWNASSWPAYKSRLGWGQSTSASPSATPNQEKRNPFTRSGSSLNSNRSSATTLNVNRSSSTQNVNRSASSLHVKEK